MVSAKKRRAPNTAPAGNLHLLKRPASTLADTVYQRLRTSIISMDLHPGTPISENTIALSEGVSRTPVREAIMRLSDERLIEVVSKSGSFVARIPASALPEALIARRALEAVTVRSATRLATNSQILALKASIECQRELIAEGDWRGFHLADEAFHEQIAGIGRLEGLWSLVRQVKIQVDRFRHLRLPEAGRMAVVLAEHVEIVDAIESRSEDLACAKMEKHLVTPQNQFAEGIEQYPDYFIKDVDPDDFPQI